MRFQISIKSTALSHTKTSKRERLMTVQLLLSVALKKTKWFIKLKIVTCFTSNKIHKRFSTVNE